MKLKQYETQHDKNKMKKTKKETVEDKPVVSNPKIAAYNSVTENLPRYINHNRCDYLLSIFFFIIYLHF